MMMRAYPRPANAWRPLGAIALAGHLALSCASAAEKAAPKAESPPPASSTALDGLIYAPNDFGAPVVTESGGARSASQADAGLPQVFVLAPPQLARTLSPQPTLYWYVSGPSSAPVRLTVLDFDGSSPEPLLEFDLGRVPGRGVYSAALADHNVRLVPGHRYEWSVALEINRDAYSEEPVAKTVLAAGTADPALLAKLEGAPALARAEALAAAGYWYDALDLLSRRMAANDPSAPWRSLRAGLLDQVGLAEVAAFDHGEGKAQ